MGGLVVAQGPTCYKFGVNLGLNPDLEFLNPDQGPDPDFLSSVRVLANIHQQHSNVIWMLLVNVG